MTLLIGILIFAGGYLLGVVTMAALAMSGIESRREEARRID